MEEAVIFLKSKHIKPQIKPKTVCRSFRPFQNISYDFESYGKLLNLSEKAYRLYCLHNFCANEMGYSEAGKKAALDYAGIKDDEYEALMDEIKGKGMVGDNKGTRHKKTFFSGPETTVMLLHPYSEYLNKFTGILSQTNPNMEDKRIKFAMLPTILRDKGLLKCTAIDELVVTLMLYDDINTLDFGGVDPNYTHFDSITGKIVVNQDVLKTLCMTEEQYEKAINGLVMKKYFKRQIIVAEQKSNNNLFYVADATLENAVRVINQYPKKKCCVITILRPKYRVRSRSDKQYKKFMRKKNHKSTRIGISKKTKQVPNSFKAVSAI